MSSLLSSVHVRYVSAGLAEIWIAAMTSSVDSAPYLSSELRKFLWDVV